MQCSGSSSQRSGHDTWLCVTRVCVRYIRVPKAIRLMSCHGAIFGPGWCVCVVCGVREGECECVGVCGSVWVSCVRVSASVYLRPCVCVLCEFGSV